VNDFETSLNRMLADTFNNILKYEEVSLRNVLGVPVTITEVHIIEAVGNQENRETTISRIASLLNISKPTATVAVMKLEQKGFVVKKPCERDARRIIVSLTDMGGRIDRMHRLFHAKMVKNISRQFADAEKEVLLRAVKTLSEFFKSRVEA